MPERIYKLQPNRTMSLRGFDHLGASAAMHSATANSFKVTGNFREASDFCVLTLWDVDDFFGHPSFKYLPDPDFANLVLTFDVQYTGLQPLDSSKFPTIDWPYLDVITMDGATSQIKLFTNPTQVGGNYAPASATFTVVDNGLQPYDRVTLWYQNLAFDMIVPNPATGVTAAAVASELADQITHANYTAAGATIGLSGTANGNQLIVTANQSGVDGNMIRLYQLNKNPNLLITPSAANLSGGDSNAVWRITVDFSALKNAGTLPSTGIRKLWMTFAPPLANGQSYAGGDWEAAFTNWTVTGPNPDNVTALQVAGPGSVRVYQTSTACTYSGTWSQVTNFYYQGFAARASTLGSTARINYSCGFAHDLYIGTLLAMPAGVAGIQLDGDAETDLNCSLTNDDVVVARRKVRSNVPAGLHVVTMVLKLGQYVDFNFLEAAVPSDVPDPPPARSFLSAALDFDTDHTYKLPPARVLWMLNQLGFSGSINEYLGVFWWNQRLNSGGVVPSVTLTFGGTWSGGDSIFLDIGPPSAADPAKVDHSTPGSVSTISKSVFPADTPATIAAHFAAFINELFSGVWASASGPALTITCRSAGYSFAIEKNPDTNTLAGTITPENGALNGGTLGDWVVDPSQSPALNTGSRAWHADFYQQCQAAGLGVVTSISMELVNPPDGFPACYHDGTAVATATGFGQYISTHCAIGGPMLGYQGAALSNLAALQTAAGLTPWLQLGEFLWWYFNGGAPASMAYYDGHTSAAATAALGRNLQVFGTPDDDPLVNSAADATFLRDRLRDHVSALVSSVRSSYPNARFEILLPLDVNYPQPVPMPVGAAVGGQLNHFVNIPPEWLAPGTAGFDSLKIEALSFTSTLRNLDLAGSAMAFGAQSGWLGQSLRYLAPVFGTASPWAKEFRLAIAKGYSAVDFWALDHICLYGWTVSAQGLRGTARARRMG